MVRLMQISGSMLKEQAKDVSSTFIKGLDRSQKGNFFSFRNEVCNGKPITIDVQFATPLPKSGRVEFDFIGVLRPSRYDAGLDDIKFIKACLDYGIITTRKNIMDHYNKLRKDFRQCEKLLAKCNGSNIYIHTLEKAQEIGNYMTIFYESLHLRSEMFEAAVHEETIGEDINPPAETIQAVEEDTMTMPTRNDTGIENHEVEECPFNDGDMNDVAAMLPSLMATDDANLSESDESSSDESNDGDYNVDKFVDAMDTLMTNKNALVRSKPRFRKTAMLNLNDEAMEKFKTILSDGDNGKVGEGKKKKTVFDKVSSLSYFTYYSKLR